MPWLSRCRAYKAGSLPIGAVVVDPAGSIVGRGRNRIVETTVTDQSRANCLFGHRLAHAEVNALVSMDHAAVQARECVLYTTLEPCLAVRRRYSDAGGQRRALRGARSCSR